MQVKKGDKVKVIAGDDKGKEGTISRVFPQTEKAIVDGVNIKKRHRRSRKEGEKGIIVEVAAPIHVSNLKKI